MKQYSIKLYEIWKYGTWYMMIQALTSFFLIYSGVIILNRNESAIGYIVYNDLILVFSYFMIGTIISVYLGAFLSSNYSHKELLQKEIFRFKYKFLRIFTDIILKFFITIAALSIRLKGVQELSPQEKLQLIGLVFFLVFIFMVFIKSAMRSIGIQLQSLLDWIGFAFLMPFYFYKTQKEEIVNLGIPEKSQRMFIIILFSLCISMFIAIVYALVTIIIMVFNDYF